jgi:hypothetical protein
VRGTVKNATKKKYISFVHSNNLEFCCKKIVASIHFETESSIALGGYTVGLSRRDHFLFHKMFK